ncbi:hypothetical protein [Borrelia sp. RT1S]|uniref:hypothetical protein n=1 Tax=Borrelia sp. RT1S TaxID=2898580 RepID=UPI001E5D0A3D|nr:hypothetical protein [Borrelia sp. RT1S]UGQ17871.1 hypothetical protein LSO05_05415 [Borrelia sp. RT1S]
MRRVTFTDGLPFDIDAIESIQDNIEISLKEYARSRFGRVVEGFDLTLSGNKISISEGYGFTPQGDLIEYSRKSEFDLSSYIKEMSIDSLSIFLTINKDNQIWVSYSSTFQPDPYKYFAGSDQFKDKLVIGALLKGNLFKLNREDQIPIFPINALIFYSRGDFTDWVTLRGCRVLSEFHDRFILFNEHAKKRGGSNLLTLKAKHIPSLRFTGKTSTAGEHTHTYLGYFSKGHVHKFGFSTAVYMTDTYTKNLEYAGAHKHTFNTDYSNSHPTPIDIEPRHITLVPIIRRY